MGLRNEIRTLEARREAGQGMGRELALAYAEMVTRKSSKRLIAAWHEALADLLEQEGRHGELIEAAGGVDPAALGAWDCQAAVGAWLEHQMGKERSR